MDHLLVIVPYRNRKEHLADLLFNLIRYLEEHESHQMSTIVISEQSEELLFNRGALINAAFNELKYLNPTHVCFHDVDCIPIQSDYSKKSRVELLIPKNVRGEWYSSVISCPTKIFTDANGFSNEYWGWGSEDADFFLRIKKKFIIRTDTRYEVALHPPSYLEHGKPRPECIKNHQRLMQFHLHENREGLNSCKYSVKSIDTLYESDQVNALHYKIELSR